jgi:tetratricopeptide (TPR) repeat protein
LAAYPTDQYAIDQPQTSQADQTSGAAYFAQAEGAFRSGDYQSAFRLANHAAIESPQNPKAPELMSLALLATGDYREAAIFAHTALSLGPPADWPTLFGYYGDESAYASQLRSLEKYVADNRSAPDAHFLLGYQYLMGGHSKPALNQFGEVVKLAPNDKLTSELIKKLSGDSTGANPPLPPQPTPGNDRPTPGDESLEL